MGVSNYQNGPKSGKSKLRLTGKRKQNRFALRVLALTVVFLIVLAGIGFGAWKLTKKKQIPQRQGSVPIVPEKEENFEGVNKFLFEPNSLRIEKGKTGEITLLIAWEKKVSLDGLDVVLKFDPEKLEIVNIEPTKIFSFVSPRIDKEKGRLILTLLETQKDKVEVEEATFLVKLTVKGKTPGETVLSVVSSQEDKVHTVLVESGSSKPLQFSSDSAKILIE